MELTLEEKKELSQLSGYLRKLELNASHLGIDLDDFISEYRDDGYAQFIVKEVKQKNSKRKETFQKASVKGENKVKTKGVK